jgi:hypothetical protein
MTNLLHKIIFLFFICGGFTEAVGIKTLLPMLPVDEAIRLQMGIDEFQRITPTISEIIGSAAADVIKENRIFGEDVGKGEIGLSSKETIYYYFVKGQLARLEWKNKTGNLALSDAKDFTIKLEKSLGIPERVKKSFFGGETGVFQATEEVYRSSGGVELQFVASLPFFSITVTDVQLLKTLDKSEVFSNITDDHSIKEWDKQNNSGEVKKSENDLDYLLMINANSVPRSNKSGAIDTDASTAEQLKERRDKATSESSSVKSGQIQSWPYLLGAVVALGILVIAVKAWRGNST